MKLKFVSLFLMLGLATILGACQSPSEETSPAGTIEPEAGGIQEEPMAPGEMESPADPAEEPASN